MRPAIKRTFIAGIICLLAPFAGFIFTVIGMVGAFNTLGQSGISDPKILEADIGVTLVAPMAGLIAGTIGLVLIVIAAILHFATRPAAPSANP